MTKRSRFTQADILRAVKGCQAAGMEVRSIAIRPDGTIEVATGECEPTAEDWTIGSPLYSDRSENPHLFGDQRRKKRQSV